MALLSALTEVARDARFSLLAAHVDHGTDDGAAQRAQAATELARRLSVPFEVLHAPPQEKARKDSEAELRARRYQALERFRAQSGARYTATAHHRQDQAETVLLRLLYGSGILGMAGIQPRHGRVVRPLLTVEPSELRHFLQACGPIALTPVEDPTNHDTTIARNYVRHLLLPLLRRSFPRLEEQAVSLATTTQRLRGPLLTALLERLEPELEGERLVIERRHLGALPPPLWPYALAALHQAAGHDYPPSAAVTRELRRQFRRGSRIGCSAGGSWRWRDRGQKLVLERVLPKPPRFTYTLSIPGAVEIAPLALRVRVREAGVEDWMFAGSRWRTGLNLPPGARATVRSRRPGDRMQPLGCSYSRRLKDILIDRRVPRQDRDALPLLVIDGAIAWVPGVTIGEPFRLDRRQQSAWIAEVVDHE